MTTPVRSRPALARALSHTPLAGSYPAASALALLALCPFIVLTTASALLQPDLVRDLATTTFGVHLAEGLSNAAYAFGAVAAADLIQRFPVRRVFLVCEAFFVAGSLVAMVSTGMVPFAIGRVLQGLGTGMLLVAALPPLVTGHGPRRLPTTAAIVNLGLFGMVTLGPAVGGLASNFHGWRVLFAVVAALGALGFVLGLLAFEESEPPARGMRFDLLAIPLALGCTALPFFGSAWLERSSFSSPGFLVPIVVGLALVALLVIGQYRKRDALMPVRIITHTLPIAGIVGAMIAGACFTTLLELAELYLLRVAGHAPLAVGALVASEVAGVVVAALLFKRVLPTRWTPLLALGGLASVIGAGALLLGLSPASASAVVPVAALLLGFGAGAGVTPGLFMAGLSVPSSEIGPTFALVELLRSEAAFLVGPVMVQLALTSGTIAGGLRLATGITVAVAIAGGLACVAIYLVGGARPHEPDLDGWLAGESPAYSSPPFAGRVRPHG